MNDAGKGFRASGRPNILIEVSDQHRAGLSNRSGDPMDTTPTLDELAHLRRTPALPGDMCRFEWTSLSRALATASVDFYDRGLFKSREVAQWD